MSAARRIEDALKRINFDAYKGLIVLVTLYFFAIAVLAPLSGDDWAWGASIGADRLANWFHDYNGRYVGNLIVLVLTRVDIARFLFETLVNVGIILAAIKLVSRFVQNEKASKITVAILILFGLAIVPIQVWGETFMSTSGFANYNTTTLSVLISILVFQSLFIRESQDAQSEDRWNLKGPRKITVIACAILLGVFTFAAQLIMENVSIFIVGFSIIVLVLAFVKRQKILLAFSQLIGAIVGATVMFSNSSYRNMFEGEAGFRQIGSTPLQSFVDIWHGRVINEVFIEGGLIFLFLSVVLFLVAKKNFVQKVLSIFALLFSTFLVAWPFLMGEFSVEGHLGVNAAVSIAAGFFLICLAVLFFSHEQRFPALLYLASIVILAPVLIQNTFGYRNFLTTFFLLALAGICILLSRYTISSRVVTILAVVASLVLGVILFGTYHNNRTFARNYTQIQAGVADGTQEIWIDRVSYPRLGWWLDPPSRIYEERKRIFLGVPDGTSLRLRER